jgi:hypothetical protein
MNERQKRGINHLIKIAIKFHRTGHDNECTIGEQIAAAFILNEQKYLPIACSDMVKAWERLGLGNYQGYVKIIKSDYMHRVKPK